LAIQRIKVVVRERQTPRAGQQGALHNAVVRERVMHHRITGRHKVTDHTDIGACRSPAQGNPPP